MNRLTRSALALPLALAIGQAVAEDRQVSYNFTPPLAPGFPQDGKWTDIENWVAPVCLQFDGQGSCVTKGWPGLQPADATETVFHEVSFGAGAPFSETTMNLDVDVSIGALTNGTHFEIGAKLGLQKYVLPAYSSPEYKTATLDNDGLIDLYGTIYSSGILDLTGGGNLAMLAGIIEARSLNISTHISGGGTIREYGNTNQTTFANSGLIEATLTALPLTLKALAPGRIMYNAGMFRAVDGAKFKLVGSTSGYADAVIQNSNGTIAAFDGSLVELSGVEIRNGTFTTSGSGRIDATGRLSLDSVTNQGLLNITGGQTLRLLDSIVNDGTIQLDTQYLNTEINLISGAGTSIGIDGTGALVLNHPTRAVLRGFGLDLINGSQHTIRGAGKIESVPHLTNLGLINANNASATLALNLANGPASPTLLNTGSIAAQNGGTLAIASPSWEYPLTLNSSGLITADTGSLVQLKYVALTGGTLSTIGTGVIRIVESASAFGSLTNLGTFELTSSTTLLGGTVTNQGSIRLGSTSSGATLNVKGNAVLAGTGTLLLSSRADNELAAASVSGATLTNGAEHTIRGAGKLGTYGLAIINDGLIEASLGSGMQIAVSGNTTQLTNNGTLRAVAGNQLQVVQKLTNFDAATATLTGGRYEAIGTLRLPVSAGIVNNGAAIVLDGPGGKIYSGSGTNDALAPFASNLADGRFEIRNGRNFNAGAFANAGQIHIGAGSTLSTASYTQHAGRTEVDGILQTSNLVIAGGELTGLGTVLGSLSNLGFLSPGNSPGTLAITGDFTQSSGTLSMELGAGNSDRLLITGTAKLGGTLAVSLWNTPGAAPYHPATGTWFDLIEAESILGVFDSVLLPVVPGIAWQLNYLVDASGTTDLVRLSTLAAPVPIPAAGFLAMSVLPWFIVLTRRQRRAGAAQVSHQ